MDGLTWLELSCGSEPGPFAFLIAFAPSPEAQTPAPVILRQARGFTVYQGALADRSQQIIERLEVYVESPSSLASGVLFGAGFDLQEARQSLWRAVLRRIMLAPGGVRRLGWEENAPPVLAVDFERNLIVPLIDEKSGNRLTSMAEAPPGRLEPKGGVASGTTGRTGSSPARSARGGAGSAASEAHGFVLEGNRSVDWTILWGEGGRVIARRQASHSLAEFLAALERCFQSGESSVDWGIPGLQPAPPTGDFLMTAPRAIQHWFVLLRLWRDMLVVVNDFYQAGHGPSLTIQPASLRIDVRPRGGLPWPWAAWPEFDPLVASFKLPAGELYVPLDFHGEWAAASLNGDRIVIGEGVLVVSKLSEFETNSARLEGSFSREATGRKMFPSGRYFVVVRIPIPGSHVEIVQEIEVETSAAVIQIDQRIALESSQARAWLQGRIGRKILNSSYTIVAPLGFCAELRAVGLMGLVLLAAADHSAAEATAEQLQIAFAGVASPLTVELVRATLDGDDRASASLSADKLFSPWIVESIPEELRWDALTAFITLLKTDDLVGKPQSAVEAALQSALGIGNALVQSVANRLFSGVESDSAIARALSQYDGV